MLLKRGSDLILPTFPPTFRHFQMLKEDGQHLGIYCTRLFFYLLIVVIKIYFYFLFFYIFRIFIFFNKFFFHNLTHFYLRDYLFSFYYYHCLVKMFLDAIHYIILFV